jgi:hypothetical protein
VDYHWTFFLNQVRIIFDVIPNHDVDNIDHNNVQYYNQNMFQWLSDHNANIAEW